MAITRLEVPLRPHPKPRGQKGKFGNMTHSVGTYRKWQSVFIDLLIDSRFQIPENFYGILFEFLIKKKGGQQPDISNLQGGIEDILVKHQLIKDDNWTVLRHYAAWAKEVKTTSSMVIYVVESKKEFLYVYEKFSD